jgi:hypothetical protein
MKSLHSVASRVRRWNQSLRRVIRHSGRFDASDDRQFRFDSTDTLPYWYSDPLRLFTDVTGNEFLDVAERWIVEKWHADTELWKWANEPRRYRFQHEHYASSNRHGALPTIERAHTHLEWHALWCTVGELLATRPLAKAEESAFEGWDYWLSRNGLTQPPHWLSDLRRVKPLERRLWFSEDQEDKEWLRAITPARLLSEIGSFEAHGDLVVASYVSTSQGERRSTLNLSSALVSSETASALIRALQTIGNAWDYKIPEEGEYRMELDAAPYRLLGWLRHPERGNKLDDDDPLRREVAACAAVPGARVTDSLKLQEDSVEPLRWIGSDADVRFRYVAWSDDMSDAASRYSTGPLRSYGHRLLGSAAAIQEFLLAQNMDLIIEVDLTRRIGESYGGDDSKNSKEAQYDFVVVLARKDPSKVPTTSGTWGIPGSRTHAGRQCRHTGTVDGTSRGGVADRGKKR